MIGDSAAADEFPRKPVTHCRSALFTSNEDSLSLSLYLEFSEKVVDSKTSFFGRARMIDFPNPARLLMLLLLGSRA